jgi:hypothetical protein
MPDGRLPALQGPDVRFQQEQQLRPVSSQATQPYFPTENANTGPPLFPIQHDESTTYHWVGRDATRSRQAVVGGAVDSDGPRDDVFHPVNIRDRTLSPPYPMFHHSMAVANPSGAAVKSVRTDNKLHLDAKRGEKPITATSLAARNGKLPNTGIDTKAVVNAAFYQQFGGRSLPKVLSDRKYLRR